MEEKDKEGGELKEHEEEDEYEEMKEKEKEEVEKMGGRGERRRGSEIEDVGGGRGRESKEVMGERRKKSMYR